MLHYQIYENNNAKDWIVFVHGMGGNYSIFYKQIIFFKKHYNLLFVDLHGHGYTKLGLKDLAECSFKTISEDVVKVLDHLKIKKAHFMGISLGTIIINTINNNFSERVKSMVLGGAVTNITLYSRILMEIGYSIKYFLPYMSLYKLCAWIIMPKKRHRVSRQVFTREAYKLGRTEFFKWIKILRKIGISEDTKILNKTNKRLYIMGSEDYMFLPIIKDEIKKDKNANIHIINKCGHVCNIESPQEFNRVSLNFFNNIKEETAQEIAG
ncbi:alpha/beta fold hydrolase [Alkaliphilus sp. B6464]|uniref:alpha/beta fold hydrolase n=1 Tax=Alkaliphilus sp. B6464 TaxID=2731219 RepID=UPI001BAE235F|nr:alpha/beta hydrolase [Alkaliphilus sp. B6464]QUH22012.1 alpha/beta hydrolase [Alkaliphilus sp. B6464]